jgi:hypothetical protein
VLVQLSGYHNVPQPLAAISDGFIGPGELIWWTTVGGVFEGFPSTIPGYVVLVVGNTVAWVLTIAIGMLTVKGVARARRSTVMPKR